MSSFRGVLLFLALGAVASCRTPGTRPEDMSAEEHEQAAKTAEATAEEHAEKTDSGVLDSGRCDRQSPCWTRVRTPTDLHKQEAQRYLKIAGEHRAAAKALVDAEASACRGIAERDRIMSPFHHREDVERVEPLRVAVGRGSETRLAGAVVTFRPVPGLTAEWLQRSIECHHARNAVIGYDTPDMAYCPLALEDVTARVRSGGDRFLIEIESGDPATAGEILKRAERLVPGG